MYYSLVDLETTGFSPRLNDKIIEIGILKIDDELNVIDTFETLVNPHRDVGATFIHGITSDMLHNAPEFDDIANDVIRILNESIIVAHNAQFDLRFLEYELNSSGFNDIQIPYICTLQMARDKLSFLPSKKLECLCDYYNIEYINKHSAMEDCKATCKIFIELYNKKKKSLNKIEPFYYDVEWNDDYCSKQLVTREKCKHISNKFKSPFFKLISRLPDIETEYDGEKQYLSILDDVLLDRIVTDQELESILEIAKECNITKNIFERLNEKYLKNLIRIYLEDNFISDKERKDIEKVKKILLLNHLDTNSLIDTVKNEHSKIISCIDKSKYEGKSVCFSGQLNSKLDNKLINRKKAQEIAYSKGLIPKKGVIKRLDYLVLADVNSQSGKAKKARQYGIPIISENAFWSMLGVQVE